ncbi:P-type conjugative transfer protein TrbJ [Cupriavidus sp. YR651]|uniref:conjugal transfer protein TrbJ n=1 Tax=Cupriavidus sp. YR651 TaxID=1855315 RepID=UPI000889110A|nr:conjugal transfer protein TrbJ [Cupriavidus sp. YR651]SDD57045.1 P-type conjugative transfer protein TrbJ [Cupriavidus sp. YR651]
MKKWFINAAAAASFAIASSAHATGFPVIDISNLIQNTMTALQSVKDEVYQNTNIAYQYKMMANQLLQATGLDPSQLTEQLGALQSEISSNETYGGALKDLYGSLSGNADYLNRVQSMVVSSGKSPGQWFEDQRTLLNNGDKTAKNLFKLGTSVFNNTEAVAKRREKIQKQMKLSPTAQATAQTTNQMLDVLASQNSDMLQLMSAKTQSDADKDQKSLAVATESAAVAEQLQADRDAQRQKILNLK